MYDVRIITILLFVCKIINIGKFRYTSFEKLLYTFALVFQVFVYVLYA